MLICLIYTQPQHPVLYQQYNCPAKCGTVIVSIISLNISIFIHICILLKLSAGHANEKVLHKPSGTVLRICLPV